MNFRRIFLVKCLLLLFPSVKCSVTRWIYLAVNKSALLNIATPGSVYEATWMRDGMKLVQIKDKKSKNYVNREQCRCTILLNGTLQIERVVKQDSGKYTVTVYHQDGKLKAEEDTMIVVQEPVPQPILSAECVNKTLSVKCEAKQKTKDETFIIELTQDKSKNQKNTTRLEWHRRPSGMFRCVVKNNVSQKMTEKVLKCSGQLDLYLILGIAGGAIFFVVFMILLIYCIRKKKAERIEDDEEEQKMHSLRAGSEMAVRELPQPPCTPTPKQLRVQQRPLPPQPQPLQPPQQALPPRPRPRTQQRTPNHPRERP